MPKTKFGKLSEAISDDGFDGREDDFDNLDETDLEDPAL
jgi:hypothetical protein